MFGLRNRFLSTTSLLLSPPNDGGGEGADDPKVVAQQADDTGDDNGGAESAAVDGEAGDEGDGESGDDDDEAGEGGEGDESGDDDGEDDLADLTPEQRARFERRLAKETGWRDRQIDRLYRQKRETAEDRDALETIATRQQQQPGDGQSTPSTPAEVQAAARQLVAQDRYDTACNTAYATGSETYKDRWETALGRLPKLGGVPREDMQNIVSTDNPHVVLFELSKPDTYERVMALPPARRLTEFVKLSLLKAPKAAAPASKRPSEAPAPVTPISGGRRVAARQIKLDDDRVSDEKWYEERNRTRRKKFSDVQ